MNEQEAIEAFFAEWDRQANEYGASLTREQRDCAEEAWHAALAWLRSQVEPAAWASTNEEGEPALIFLDRKEACAYCDGDEPLPLFLAPQVVERDDREYLAAIAMLGSAMRRLVIAARTSGGTAGPDEELMAACAQAEDVMTVGAIGRAMLAPQPATPDGWQPIIKDIATNWLPNMKRKEWETSQYAAIHNRAVDDCIKHVLGYVPEPRK